MLPLPGAEALSMETPYLCSIFEAAKAMGVGRTKMNDMIKSRELESIKIGTRRLVKMDSIRAFIERATGGAI